VPGWATLDQLVAIGVLPPEAREALVRVRLEQTERAAPGAICRRIANAEDAPPAMVERCRAWLAATSERPTPPTSLGLCRRIANAESVDPTLVERCRTILAEAADGRPSERPIQPAAPSVR
jgi:hypothetical protein